MTAGGKGVFAQHAGKEYVTHEFHNIPAAFERLEFPGFQVKKELT
jgi:hypothetical protein